MARNGIKSGGRDFKPGNKASKGKHILPPELKQARKQSRQDVEALVLKYKNMTQAQLEAVMKNAETPAEEILVIRVILRGIAKGDASTLLFLTDFLFGKKPEAIHITSVNQTINTNISLSQMCKNPDVFDTLVTLDAKLKGLPENTSR